MDNSLILEELNVIEGMLIYSEQHTLGMITDEDYVEYLLEVQNNWLARRELRRIK